MKNKNKKETTQTKRIDPATNNLIDKTKPIPTEIKTNTSYRLRSNISKLNNPRALTPIQFQDLFIEWYNLNNEAIIEVEVDFATREGNALKVIKRNPLSILNFCIYAGISYSTFLRYETDKDFELYRNTAEMARMVTASRLQEKAETGEINASVARWIGANMTNNMLADRKEININTSMKEPPSWLSTSKPDETIEIEGGKGTKELNNEGTERSNKDDGNGTDETRPME